MSRFRHNGLKFFPNNVWGWNVSRVGHISLPLLPVMHDASLCVLLWFHPHVSRTETEIRIFSHQSNSTKSATKLTQWKKIVSDIALLPHSALESQSHASRPISAWEVQPDKLIDVGSDNFVQVLVFPKSADPRAENVGTLSQYVHDVEEV